MSVPRATRFRILARDGFACRYCGRLAPNVELEVDHRHPRRHGGSDGDYNLVTACFDCNRGKRDKVYPRPTNHEGMVATMAGGWAYGTMEILGEYGDVQTLDLVRVGRVGFGPLYDIIERTVRWIQHTPQPRPKGSEYLRDLVFEHFYPGVSQARCG